MFCKNRITLIGFIGKDAQTRYTPGGIAYTRFSLATNISWKDKATDSYQSCPEWQSIVVWGKFGEWAGGLKKGVRRSRGRAALSRVSAQGL
jgi:single-strand DNA-binding protein